MGDRTFADHVDRKSSSWKCYFTEVRAYQYEAYRPSMKRAIYVRRTTKLCIQMISVLALMCYYSPACYDSCPGWGNRLQCVLLLWCGEHAGVDEKGNLLIIFQTFFSVISRFVELQLWICYFTKQENKKAKCQDKSLAGVLGDTRIHLILLFPPRTLVEQNKRG